MPFSDATEIEPTTAATMRGNERKLGPSQERCLADAGERARVL